MSDSGFGQISSPSRPAAQNSGGGDQIVKILGLPQSLKGIARAVRLEGQVTQQNSNGSFRIATPEGNIDVEVKAGRQPQLGQKVEIDVPAGRQPRQATLREPSIDARGNRSPTQTNEQGRSTHTPAQTSSRYAAPDTVPRSFVTTEVKGYAATKHSPIPPALQEAAGRTANTTTQARPLLPEALVRLLPTAPAQAQTIATEYQQTLPQPQNNLMSRILFASNLIADNANSKLGSILIESVTAPRVAPQQLQPQLQQPLLQLPQLQPLSQQPPSPLNLILQNATQPLGNNNFLQTQPAPPVIFSTPQTALPPTTIATTLPITQNTAVIPQNLTAPVTQIENILPASGTAPPLPATTTAVPQTAVLTPIPVTFDPAAPIANQQPIAGRIDVQVLSVTPPTPTITAPTATTELGTIIPAKTNFTPPILGFNNAVSASAQVTGFTPQGLPLVTVQWPGTSLPQSFVLQFNSNNLQLGSQLQITPRVTTVPLPSFLPAQAVTNPLLMGFQWPALDELYNALLQISPAAIASLSRSLPNPASPSQIGPAAMMFIAAVRSGDLSGWLGDKKIDLLQKSGRANILEKLVQRGNSAARTAAPEPAAPASEWRAVPLPMFWEGAIHKITLYTRNEQEQQEKEDQKGGQTRFVFDLSLSRMGDVQLDGLLQDKRLDLVVRTQNAFSLPMQQTMRQAYAGALGDTELTGDLNFQSNTNNWVHVLEEKEQLGVNV